MPNQSHGFDLKRVWIKKPNGVPTTLQVGPDDLIDDLKTAVMQKYPTTLAREIDPADLVIRLDNMPGFSTSPPYNASGTGTASHSAKKNQKNSSRLHPQFQSSMQMPDGSQPISPIPISSTKSPLLPATAHLQRPSSRTDDDSKSQSPFSSNSTILRPDQNVWRVLDQYYPNGMTMTDAFIIEAPQNSRGMNADRGSRGGAPSPYSNVFNSYMSPQKESGSNAAHRNSSSTTQPGSKLSALPLTSSNTSLPPSSLPMQQGSLSKSNYKHNLSFSGDVNRQLSGRKSTTAATHRRSMSNPQSPSSASFTNNATILMLPKDYHGSSANKDHNQWATHTRGDSSEQKSLDKITELKQDEANLGIPTANSPTSSMAPSLPNKKIKTTTEKVFPSINILIVEDNKINQKILQAFLRKRKINFQTAVNGEEAIEKWKQGGFHLVLMDIQLPVKSGMEAAIEIRRLEKANYIGLFSSKSSKAGNNKIPHEDELDVTLFRSPVIIVALTASTSSADRQKALAAGCNDYLTKPVNLDWLQNKITEWGCMQALIDFDHWNN